MKKFITLTIALAAIVSQAASIDWKISSTRNTFVFDSAGEKFSGTAYLVLSSDVAGMTSGTLADLQTKLTEKALDSVTMSNGAYAIDPARTATSSSISGTEPWTFQILFLDVPNGQYALSGTASEVAYTAGVDDPTGIAFGATLVGAARTAAASTLAWNALSSGGDEPSPGGDDPTPGVPEPATGALALAGLALLFRRKKA